MKRADGHPIDDLPLFSGLDRELVDRLASGTAVRSLDDPALLFEEGEPADRLYVLLDGTVELFTDAGARGAVILLVWPLETFLGAAALTDEPYLLSARTLGPARLIELNAALLRREAELNPVLAIRIARIVSGQFRMVIRNLKDLKVRAGPERLGAYLLRLVDERGTQGCADLPIPKALLASRLGLSAETVSRAFHTLREQGLTVRGSKIIVTDRARLEGFCGFDSLIDGREPHLSITAIPVQRSGSRSG